MSTILKSAILAAAVGAFALAAPVHAITPEGSAGTPTTATTDDMDKTEAGDAATESTDAMSCEAPTPLYDAESTTCVAECPEGSIASEAGDACELQDAFLYRQGRQLALDGQYDRALAMLNAADRSDPMVLTMSGYALRKSGRLQDGIALYHQALAIDPGNPYTLEYLGEGYVAAGNLPLALEQLHLLKTTCGAECDQYRQLASVISGQAGWQ